MCTDPQPLMAGLLQSGGILISRKISQADAEDRVMERDVEALLEDKHTGLSGGGGIAGRKLRGRVLEAVGCVRVIERKITCAKMVRHEHDGTESQNDNGDATYDFRNDRCLRDGENDHDDESQNSGAGPGFREAIEHRRRCNEDSDAHESGFTSEETPDERQAEQECGRIIVGISKAALNEGKASFRGKATIHQAESTRSDNSIGDGIQKTLGLGVGQGKSGDEKPSHYRVKPMFPEDIDHAATPVRERNADDE